MIPIIKGNEPKALTEAKRDIQNTPDASFDYSSLRGEHKRKILEALVAEQGHLCAYCMCRIGTNDNAATSHYLGPRWVFKLVIQEYARGLRWSKRCDV